MKILVVDDEPLIAQSLARTTRSEGFEPTVAHNGAEAWSLVEHSPQEWQMLITDIRMPLLDGISLAQRIRALGLVIPVLFISGHGECPNVEALYPAVFLAKPFRRAQLREAINVSVVSQNQSQPASA